MSGKSQTEHNRPGKDPECQKKTFNFQLFMLIIAGTNIFYRETQATVLLPVSEPWLLLLLCNLTLWQKYEV